MQKAPEGAFVLGERNRLAACSFGLCRSRLLALDGVALARKGVDMPSGDREWNKRRGAHFAGPDVAVVIEFHLGLLGLGKGKGCGADDAVGHEPAGGGAVSVDLDCGVGGKARNAVECGGQSGVL